MKSGPNNARGGEFGSLFFDERRGGSGIAASEGMNELDVQRVAAPGGAMTEQMLLRLVGEHAYAITSGEGREEMNWPDLLANGWRIVSMVGSGGPEGAAYVLLERGPVKA